MKLEKIEQTGSNTSRLLLVFSDETRLKAPPFVAADLDLFREKN